MERLYRALVRLSVVALVVGVVDVLLVALGAGQGAGSGPLAAVGPSSLAGALGDWVNALYYPAYSWLAAGVAITGMVVAWMADRKLWLVALVVLTLIVISAANAGPFLWLSAVSTIRPGATPSMTFSLWLVDNLGVLAHGLNLIPVLVVLVPALTRPTSTAVAGGA